MTDMRRGGQFVRQELLEDFKIRRDDFQDEIDLAVQHVAFAHQRPASATILEGLEIVVVLAVQGHEREDGDRQAERLGVEARVVALDEARLLESTHAPEARGGRDPHPARQLDIGDAALGLELGKDFSVDLIELVAGHADRIFLGADISKQPPHINCRPDDMETTEAIWAVSDGRAGLANQVRGLAEAVARISPRPIEVKTTDFYEPWRALAPGLLASRVFGPSWLTLGSNAFAPPWPRLFIGCGRAATALSLYLRRIGAKTFRVQTQDPRVSPAQFDLVVPPLHDDLSGPNVFPILGSPNRITQEALNEAEQKFAARYAPLPRPRAGVLIGGTMRGHPLERAQIDRLAETLLGLTKSGLGLMVTVSRRTGEENVARLRAALAGTPVDFAGGGTGENPYLGILALADFLLVTEDSTNMATEAAAAGKPVYILPLAGVRPKQARLHAEMFARGIARPFAGVLELFSYPPLVETARAATEIARRANL